MADQFRNGTLLLAAALATGAPLSAAPQNSTERVSVASNGKEANGSSFNPALSASGQFVAFTSEASDLVRDDHNNRLDVFVHDRSIGKTRRASVASDGGDSNGHSTAPKLSADGRFIVFESGATNLVPNDTTAGEDGTDIFLHNLETGRTKRVSIGLGGVDPNTMSSQPAISANGQVVAFTSHASNLVSGDNNDLADIFIHNVRSGITVRASIGMGGVDPEGGVSTNPELSADGRFVAFDSSASNLVPNDTNGISDIFIRDLKNSTTERVSLTHDGSEAQGGESTGHAVISADGRFVVYDSDATNLVPNDNNSSADVFLRDRRNDTTERVSLGQAGEEADLGGGQPEISADGRLTAFESSSTNLVPNDGNGSIDIFVRDRKTNTTERMSVAQDGSEADDASTSSAISGDGKFVTFSSAASNLVRGDTNGAGDIFVRAVDADG